jgi:hypothetical protein
MQLNRAAEILSWSPAELDPLRLSLRAPVLRVVIMIGVNASLDGTLDPPERDRDAIFERLARDLHSTDKAVLRAAKIGACGKRPKKLRARSLKPRAVFGFGYSRTGGRSPFCSMASSAAKAASDRDRQRVLPELARDLRARDNT